MTRVILTNKVTGQKLPEAELTHETPNYFGTQFDGTTANNGFFKAEWDIEYVREYRAGDVLRRVDRDPEDPYFYIYAGDDWWKVMSAHFADAMTTEELSDTLNDPEWEVV